MDGSFLIGFAMNHYSFPSAIATTKWEKGARAGGLSRRCGFGVQRDPFASWFDEGFGARDRSRDELFAPSQRAPLLLQGEAFAITATHFGFDFENAFQVELETREGGAS